jgi:hypothetical protein
MGWSILDACRCDPDGHQWTWGALKSAEIDGGIGRTGGTQMWSQTATRFFLEAIFLQFLQLFTIGDESPTLSASLAKAIYSPGELAGNYAP